MDVDKSNASSSQEPTPQGLESRELLRESMDLDRKASSLYVQRRHQCLEISGSREQRLTRTHAEYLSSSEESQSMLRDFQELLNSIRLDMSCVVCINCKSVSLSLSLDESFISAVIHLFPGTQDIIDILRSCLKIIQEQTARCAVLRRIFTDLHDRASISTLQLKELAASQYFIDLIITIRMHWSMEVSIIPVCLCLRSK